MKKNTTLLLTLSLFLLACSHPKENTNRIIPMNCNEKYRDSSLTVSNLLSPHADSIKNNTGVYVLEDGGGSMVTRAWFSEYAEHSIDIQYFIFSTDNVGLIACDYLVRAADRGVQVRILLDDLMVDADLEDVLMLNSHENISIKIYNPGVNLGKSLFGKIKTFASDFKSANQRMHNKTFTVDQKIVITGGRNIADEYFDYDHDFNFRDRDVLLLGKEVEKVNQSFEVYWNNELSVDAIKLVDQVPERMTDSNRFNALHEYACNPENFWPQIREKLKLFPKTFNEIVNSRSFIWTNNIEFIADEPGKNQSDDLHGGGLTTDKILELISEAKNTIDIQTPYLITTPEGESFLKAAIDRGVKIRILTNSLASTDNIEAFSAYQEVRETLLKIGIEIFEFRPDAQIKSEIMTGELHKSKTHKPLFGLHAKTMVIDGKISVIGTFNADPRSANLNTECITVVKSKPLSEEILKGMETEYRAENSWKISLEFNPDNEVSNYKQIKTWTRKVLPKSIL